MTPFDWFVLAAAAGGLILGARAGVAVALCSIAGLLAGIAVGLAVVPRATLLIPPDQAIWRSVALRGGFVVVALVFVAIGRALGYAISDRLRHPFARGLDMVLGAVGGVAVIVAGVWILVSISLPTSSLVASSRGSYTEQLVEHLPAPPSWITDIRTYIADIPALAPINQAVGGGDLRPAPAASPLTPDTRQRVERSSLQIWSKQCGRIYTGSGFVVGPGLVVTNAHVVAGANDVDVSQGNDDWHAEVVAFAPERDLAVLRVTDLDRPSLELAGDEPDGTALATVGHPGGRRDLDVSPAVVNSEQFANLENFYGDAIALQIYVLTAPGVAKGSSGGPAVDAEGRVAGIVFATDTSGAALAIAASELRPVLQSGLATPVSTGRCAPDAA